MSTYQPDPKNPGQVIQILDPVSINPADLQNQIVSLQSANTDLQTQIENEVKIFTQRFQPQIDANNAQIQTIQNTLATIYTQVPTVAPAQLTP